MRDDRGHKVKMTPETRPVPPPPPPRAVAHCGGCRCQHGSEEAPEATSPERER